MRFGRFLVGAAALMSASTGDIPDLDAAVDRMVRLGTEIRPDPQIAELYDRMMPIYEQLYEHSKAFYDDLDAL